MKFSKKGACRLVMTLLLFVMGAAMLFAQPGGRNMTIKADGSVVDSKTSEPLVGVAVKVTSSDGGTGTFGISDADGKFTFEVNRPGKYSLEVTYVGYKTLHKDVNIFPGRAKVGQLKLKEDPKMLAEVEAVGHSQRIKQKGDTLAYNADAYKVQDGASAEELVGKMPGIEVTSEGVKAQGETVQKILVDGKEFFDNDVKMALRSLPAEVLESVNIFDKKSDQAEFTGIDDGETVKAMDLITKSYRRNGVFGKVFGGIGNNFDWDNGYWNTGFNINIFDGNRRITLQGMSNNVNERNFSTDDMAPSGMMNRQWGATGVARSNGLGINFNDSYFDEKLEVQMSYFFNQTRTVSSDSTLTDTFMKFMDRGNNQVDTIPGSSSIGANDNLSHSTNHRIGGRITYKPSKRDEIMFRPSLNFNSSDGLGDSRNYLWNTPMDSVLTFPSVWNNPLSSTVSHSTSENDSWNMGGNLLWRHRMNKPGRTISVNVNGNVSSSEGDRRTNSTMTTKLNPNGTRYNQQDVSDSHSSRISGNVQWTEPLMTGLNLSLRYDVNYNTSKRERNVYLYDENDINFTGKNPSLDLDNSNTFEQKNLRNSGELGLNFNKGTLRVDASARLENSRLEGEQVYMGSNARSFVVPTKNYNSFLPNLRVEYRTTGGTQFQFNYNARSSNPSVDNLQQSVNTTNRNAFTTGNPNLDQSRTHNMSLRMIYTNTETAQNFMIFGGFNATQGRVSTQKLTNLSESEVLSLADLDSNLGFTDEVFKDIKLQPGVSISRPVNRDGYMTANLNMGYGFPFDLIMSNVNVSVGGNYSISPSERLEYFGKKDENTGKPVVSDIETKTRMLGFNPRLHISSNISTDLNFNLMYAPSFQWAEDTNGSDGSRDYINHSVNANLNWTFWEGFTTDQVLSYSRFGGPAQPEAIEQWIWNASLGKKFLKGNAAEIKLQAYDILGSNKGFSRNVGESSIRTTYRNFMPRYFLLTFTYKITAYRAAKGNQQSTRTQDEGFGGGFPGGGFPGGGRGGFGGGGFGGGRPF